MTTHYKKVGRRYQPVAEHEEWDSFPEGAHLVICQPGSTMRRFSIDPDRAGLLAAAEPLRAEIEAMEKQQPVAFALYSGRASKAVYLSEIEACEQRDRRQLTADLGGSLEAYRVVPLYALPGAKGED